MPEIKRLHLASVTSPDGGIWPVHGFVILHEQAGPILATGAHGEELMIGDAAYTSNIYARPDREKLPNGQAADRVAWRRSLEHIHALRPGQVHFCHDTAVVHS